MNARERQMKAPRILVFLPCRLRLSWGLALLGILLVGCGGEKSDTGSSPLRKLQIQADWYAQPEHAGFYLAAAKGYYKESGFDMEVLAGGPNDNTRQKVAQGEVTFGVGRLEDVIMAFDRGLPLVAVGAYLQRIPLSLMVHSEQPVYSVEDIGERLVMATAGSLYLPRLEARYGIALNTIPHMRTIARFVSDEDLVQQCYLTNEPYFVEQAGVDVRVLPMFEAGIDSFRVLYTRREMVTDHPELVQQVVAQSHRGWAEYIADNNEYEIAHHAIKERNPSQELVFMAWARQQILKHGIVTGPSMKVDDLRSVTRERVQEMADELLSLGLVGRPYMAEELVAWEVVDPVLEGPIPSK